MITLKTHNNLKRSKKQNTHQTKKNKKTKKGGKLVYRIILANKCRKNNRNRKTLATPTETSD